MSRNKSLTELRNIGKKIADRLNHVGIFSEDDLRRVGAVGAYRMIRDRCPDETLPVCYYLYSFEGALTDAPGPIAVPGVLLTTKAAKLYFGKATSDVFSNGV